MIYFDIYLFFPTIVGPLWCKFKQIVSLKTQFSPLKESVSFDGKIQCENKALQPNW